ncbi:MAG: hypothetical protein, partial [Olavius algarvensis Gamma 1 endosymbiont]
GSMAPLMLIRSRPALVRTSWSSPRLIQPHARTAIVLRMDGIHKINRVILPLGFLELFVLGEELFL